MAKQPRLPETPDGTQPSGAAPAPSYVVGYGLPPAHTRYKPGHRGCGGRPKRQRNVGTVLKDTLDERITIREGKRTRSVSKLDAIILAIIADFLGRHGNQAEPTQPPESNEKPETGEAEPPSKEIKETKS
ncbi:MAG: hypothetical protein E6G86_18170 [Alphaproteobacteria bacterium]|nr:MAG: hypothetical protein E6G86_18170 [Alphaproteobacteria bacterium]